MKLNGKVKYMGSEHGISNKDGKPYYKVGLMQGLESKVFYVDQKTYDNLYSVNVGTDMDINIDINEYNGKTYFSLVDYQIIDKNPLKKLSA
ncbi:MAG: hypothetical protein QXI16_03510 [Sulfolobaceae archaeon]